ncbi:hypothetical protein OG413_45430 [Streptomyces sp. NBC_01433]|uniref:hypothetical protein n=1 Tax=Streptomyces sp. NBC_01433 TaxID=2903864 RepID=UPI0022571A49|nr:hypothetical protein [Streptomyces sp. NBC_01433]MCX4681352.1 hypothetical protein [Streptomyces sp. NBC_01433]MCX4681710.1 hypothetical protein [Streptomyces sp. NBC_01433]MCX4682428.1 hypothetical protein [Streptomyces sp. NBC_01433]
MTVLLHHPVQDPAAVEQLSAALRELAEQDPERAYGLIEDLVLKMVTELPDATGAFGRIELRDYGRAHTLLDDAGILIKQAAGVLLGLPVAGRRAEREMVAQALAAPDRDPADRAEHRIHVWTRPRDVSA